MLDEVRVIAWDFDGVLNRNIRDGALIWHQDFEQDLGLPLAGFKEAVFRSGRFGEAMLGHVDILEVLAGWIASDGLDGQPEDVLDYWLTKDDLPDPAMVELTKRLDVEQVIATNNEPRRTAFIAQHPVWGNAVKSVFSSGRLGVAKPDPAFFQKVVSALDVLPKDILLVDDSAENVAAARACGWRAFHFSETSRDEFLGKFDG